jgi:rhodanese-related sulfurtransferase
MSLHLISASEAMAQLDQFDAILDARSEGEHAEDHLPGALSWPSLNNEERIKVGTLYKQVNPFEAQKVGAALVAKNIARHIETQVMDKPKTGSPWCIAGAGASAATPGADLGANRLQGAPDRGRLQSLSQRGDGRHAPPGAAPAVQGAVWAHRFGQNALAASAWRKKALRCWTWKPLPATAARF